LIGCADGFGVSGRPSDAVKAPNLSLAKAAVGECDPCVTPAVRQCSKRSLARAAVGELAVLLPTTPAVLAPDANIAGSRLIDLGIRGVLDGELGVANSARKSSIHLLLLPER